MQAGIFIFAAGSQTDAVYIGYADMDMNGVNDNYCDGNGDGINDINGEKLFEIEFIDSNHDGINDIYTDNDGDGVNDLYISSGIMPVMDIDHDLVNDITGTQYCSGNYRGYMTGKNIEETGNIIEFYVDENGNFTDDSIEERMYEFRHDKFIDEDNDGICDGRENKLSPQKKRGHK